jgi:hypothetical protein
MIRLGDITTGVPIDCAAHTVEAVPEVDSTDYKTFCGAYTSYGPEKWTVTCTVLQSFGAAGFWNLVRPLANTVVPFTILPDNSTANSVTNVAMVGTARVMPFAFLSGGVGEPSEFDLVLGVSGTPTFPVTGATMMAAEAEAMASARAAAGMTDTETDDETETDDAGVLEPA